MELLKGDRYLFLHNDGPRSPIKLYRWATHVSCTKRMTAVRELTDEGDTQHILYRSGTHTADVSAKMINLESQMFEERGGRNSNRCRPCWLS